MYRELGFTCSAGIGPNKLLAKLCSGMHKPAQQTVICPAAVAATLRDLPLDRLRSLGGKFGERVAAELGATTVGQLAEVPLARLERAFGEQQGRRLFDLARGQLDEPVKERDLLQSFSTGKNFRGNLALRSIEEARGEGFLFRSISPERATPPMCISSHSLAGTLMTHLA